MPAFVDTMTFHSSPDIIILFMLSFHHSLAHACRQRMNDIKHKIGINFEYAGHSLLVDWVPNYLPVDRNTEYRKLSDYGNEA